MRVARWAEGIERVHECIAGRFRRPEPRRRALDYLKGAQPGGAQERLAIGRAGDATPVDYQWDADLVRMT